MDQFAAFGVAPGAGRTVVQAKTPETANFDSIATGQRASNGLKNLLDGDLRVSGDQARKAGCQGDNEFGASHPNILPPGRRLAIVIKNISENNEQSANLPTAKNQGEKNPAPVWHGIKDPIVAMDQGGSNIVSGGR